MGSKNEPKINQAFTLLVQHEEEGKKVVNLPRLTNAYTTSDWMIDEYIGGGYGRLDGGYEIVLIFAGTGMNKSTFASQMIIDPALQGKRIAYYSLEDDPADLWARLYLQVGGLKGNKFESTDEMMRKVTKQIMIAPDSDGYTLEQMAVQIEQLFDMGVDIIVIDPLQFIFEASVVEKTETEYNRQRLFMRQVNNLVKRASRKRGQGKTIIFVSHTNKGKFDDSIDTIMGSGANKQVPTKILQLQRDKDGHRFINMVKSRFTKHRVGKHEVVLDPETMLIRTAPLPIQEINRPERWWNEVRKGWDRGCE